MLIQLTSLTPLFKLDKEGNEIPTGKTRRLKLLIPISSITLISETCNTNGHVYKNKCSVNIEGFGLVTIAKPFKQMKNIKESKPRLIGFKR